MDAPLVGVAQWYALYLRSRFEKKTYNELQRKQIESFLPLIEEVHVWSDRKKKVLEPLFRCYLFVKTNLRNEVDILQTEGVVRFIGIQNYPSPIPEEQIEWVRIVVGHPQVVRREDSLVVGDRVAVIAGPFKGIRGCVTTLRGSTRVGISLTGIPYSISVEVEQNFLQPLGEEYAAGAVK